MKNAKRCKRQREAKLYVAALNVSKLSSFGTNITPGKLQETTPKMTSKLSRSLPRVQKILYLHVQVQ